MSEFTDAWAQAFDEANEVFGLLDVTLNGRSYFGTFDSFAATKEQQDEGGFLPEYDATCIIKASLLSPYFNGPLEKALPNLLLTVGTRVYRIERAVVDEISVTLLLKS
jgi:hypothetical protein